MALMRSINPFDGTELKVYETWDDKTLDKALTLSAEAVPGWADTAVDRRCALMKEAASVLRRKKEELARMITLEMGKLICESRAEIDKCALACDYYAEHGPAIVADEPVATDAGKSLVVYEPLGTVLAIMPWNFPFWQVFRFAAPALVAGNTGLLKHASNVPQCGLAIEQVFRDAGFPDGVFQNLMIPASMVSRCVQDERVHAATLTGSESAGRKVAAAAGEALKKTVLELGGSDPFIVLDDADIDEAARQAVASRFLNSGQSCISAKRFIVLESVAHAFLERFKAGTEALKPGNPLDETTTLAPLARPNLRDELHNQVTESLRKGAKAVTGCEPVPGPGAFYKPSILTQIPEGTPAWSEEFFGPVASVFTVKDEQSAIRIANITRFGLGSSVWTSDTARGERLARKLQAGACFVNGIVKSDPRLPFGGIKASGYGRELSYHGLREFVNIKTLWIR
ncbi:MAG TPA: NAD-dependent succinate-semialdehyde dehydrogenase [Thermodesulfovibrionia bacterium]|nr:NAD-dependent succinate-semialdehyde dehydrogenase [Thermodesulfovibrionia bacterium]